MSRGIGAIEAFQSGPDLVLDALAMATWLGSAPIIAAGVVAWYWAGRRDAATLLGALVAAASVTIALKGAFELARPPAALHLTYADGFGFPSGHAIAATVGWGGAALLLDRWSPGRRLALAGAVVGLVAISRVALGVHYAVDVIAGVAVGLAVLGGLWQVWTPIRTLGAGAAAAVAAAVITAGGTDAGVLLGLVVAGVIVLSVRPEGFRPTMRRAIPGGLALLVGLYVGVTTDSVLIAIGAGAWQGLVVFGVPATAGAD